MGIEYCFAFAPGAVVGQSGVGQGIPFGLSNIDLNRVKCLIALFVTSRYLAGCESSVTDPESLRPMGVSSYGSIAVPPRLRGVCLVDVRCPLALFVTSRLLAAVRESSDQAPEFSGRGLVDAFGRRRLASDDFAVRAFDFEAAWAFA